jgi:hypothetical protein
MADLTKIKWLYPPNFVGTYGTGTKNGHRRHVVLCTNISDATGETDEIKLKRTDMLTSEGQTPSKLVVEKIDYHIAGMTVKISYNNENEELVALLYTGDGVIDFRPQGGFVPEDEVEGEDPEGGDIVFTTSQEAANDSYNIILTVRLKQ